MNWFILALASALFASVRDLLSKQYGKEIDPLLISWSMGLFSLPFLGIALSFTSIPTLGPGFWPSLFAAGLLLPLAWILYIKALSLSDLSLTIPMMATNPIFVLLIAALLLGEKPGAQGMAGIVLIVAGTFVLSSGRNLEGSLRPFLALRNESGPKLMLFVALLFSVVAVFEKAGIQSSAPILFVFLESAAATLVMAPVVCRRNRRGFREMGENWRKLLPVGLFTALMLICQSTAMSLGPVAYVISLKRTGILLSVFAGCFLLREEGFRGRVLGAFIMVIGAVVLSFA